MRKLNRFVTKTAWLFDFEIEGEYPQFGNNDERVDSIACDLVERFMKRSKHRKTYRNAIPTQSVLTITSNVVYGKKTGNTPMVVVGAPFGPGANPMHGRDQKGAVASLTSVAKLPFALRKRRYYTSLSFQMRWVKKLMLRKQTWLV